MGVTKDFSQEIYDDIVAIINEQKDAGIGDQIINGVTSIYKNISSGEVSYENSNNANKYWNEYLDRVTVYEGEIKQIFDNTNEQDYICGKTINQSVEEMENYAQGIKIFADMISTRECEKGGFDFSLSADEFESKMNQLLDENSQKLVDYYLEFFASPL